MDYIVPPLSYKDVFDIKLSTKVDIPINKETKPKLMAKYIDIWNQTKPIIEVLLVTWNHVTVYELLLLDRNTRNRIIVQTNHY